MDVKLPSLGEGADSGVIVSILVKEGDAVQQGQTILELENEKAVAPIPATGSGRVSKIYVKAGDRISVGTKILTIGDGAGAAEAPDPAAAPSAAAAPAAKPARKAAARPVVVEEESVEAEADEDEIPADAPVPAASPGARKIAHELGIDLRRVSGSEPGGRIVMGDLRNYVQRLIAQARSRKAAPAAAAAAPARVVESIDFTQWGEVTKKPLTQLRKVISRRMGESWHAVPRVTQFEEVDITDLMALRKKHNDAYKAKGANLTVTCFALKALVSALKKHPIFNSSLDEAAQEIVFKEYFHIGIAVDTEGGLLVPVIRDVDKKSLLDLAKELGSLAERARDRKITADEMKGGTFTISNQGAIGGGHFTPIVNLPEVAILGMGKGLLKPAVVNGKIEPRLMLPLTVAYDHRVIDGGTAARFTVDLTEALAKFTDADVKL
jgi:pyruvate dehydrogenase E2 component (dihydrolipoamide acetyltransferase)